MSGLPDKPAVSKSVRPGPLLAGAFFFLLCVWPVRERVLTGQNDFLSLYCGATLAGTPHLYDRPAVSALQRQLVGVEYPAVHYTRLPFWALLLKPLSWLPYRVAYAVLQAISFASLLWLLGRYRRDYPPLDWMCALSFPVMIHFLNGQDTLIALAATGGSFLLLERRRDRAAGLLFGLAAIKYHLFLLAGLGIVLQRRWRAVQGLAIAATAAWVLSVLAAGLDWPRQMMATIQNPAVHPKPTLMLTFYGMFAAFGIESLTWEIAACLLVTALFACYAWRQASLAAVFAAALIAGPLVAHHAYVQDGVLTLLALPLLRIAQAPRRLQLAAQFCSLPVLYLCFYIGPPWSAAVPLGLLGLFLAYIFYVPDHSAGTAAGNPAS